MKLLQLSIEAHAAYIATFSAEVVRSLMTNLQQSMKFILNSSSLLINFQLLLQEKRSY